MSKYLVLADLHLHDTPIWRFDWNTSFLEGLLQYKKEHDLVLLGDVFELRNKIDVRVINQFLNFILQWEKKIYWVLGQHDSYLPGEASLAGLNILDNLIFIDKTPLIIDDTAFIPYNRNGDLYREQVSNTLSKYCFTHIPVSEAGFSVAHSIKDFTKFEKVISGDIHNPHCIDSEGPHFKYVGSVSQLDFRDENSPGYYGLVDKVSFELERIPTNPLTFLTIKTTQDLEKLTKQTKVVRNYLEKDVELPDNVEIKEVKKDIDVSTVFIKPTRTGFLDSIIDNKDLDKEYVKSFRIGE